MGWTECTATLNVRDKEVADAIFLKLPPVVHRNVSLCEMGLDEDHQKSLQRMHDNGYGSLPVLFLKETRGMDSSECNRFWGGQDCEDGYRKEFFAQEWNFTSGACLARPLGCSETYYFPVDSTTGLCSAFLDDIKSTQAGMPLCDGERRWALASDMANELLKNTESVVQIHFLVVFAFQAATACVLLLILCFPRKTPKIRR